MASSRARTLDSRPTTNGVIMYGKMTTSRIGIMGSRFVSDFSFEVSIVLPWRGILSRIKQVGCGGRGLRLAPQLVSSPISHRSGNPPGGPALPGLRLYD